MIEKVQIKYDGDFKEFLVESLDLNPDSPSDADVRTAVERHLEAGSLAEFVVEPPENNEARAEATVLVMRPTATYGKLVWRTP